MDKSDDVLGADGAACQQVHVLTACLRRCWLWTGSARPGWRKLPEHCWSRLIEYALHQVEEIAWHAAVWTVPSGSKCCRSRWTLLELTSSLYGILTCQMHAPNATSDYTVILYVAVVGAAYIITMDRDYDAASPIRNLWPCDEARALFNRLPEPLVALRRGKGAIQ